jgi:hypothetical protein
MKNKKETTPKGVVFFCNQEVDITHGVGEMSTGYLGAVGHFRSTEPSGTE